MFKPVINVSIMTLEDGRVDRDVGTDNLSKSVLHEKKHERCNYMHTINKGTALQCGIIHYNGG